MKILLRLIFLVAVAILVNIMFYGFIVLGYMLLDFIFGDHVVILFFSLLAFMFFIIMKNI